ncbi:MAG: branched-chain amino acid aminotransferase [Thermoanaerobaculum sp.]
MDFTDRSVVRAPDFPLDPNNLPFGRTFSPNMFLMDYDEERGWHDPRIVPFGPLSLSPATMVFHYGQEIFEGLKAFRHPDGSVHIFRPDRNAARFNRSARRMSMPEIPEPVQLEAMRALVAVDREWVPPTPGALYIRPTMIATQESLGVSPSTQYLYFIITGPTGPYFRTAGKTLRIMIARDWVRAAPGGTGAAKTGGNYAASLLARKIARDHGCAEALWLDAVERRHVEEVGAMNIMFVLDGVVTTPPTSGTILEGVTRESIGVLCKELGIPFVQRAIHIEEIIQGLESGDCTEVFGCGTAAVVAPVGELVDILPDGSERVYKVGDGNEGPVAKKLREVLTGIQFGTHPDTHGWLVRV